MGTVGSWYSGHDGAHWGIEIDPGLVPIDAKYVTVGGAPMTWNSGYSVWTFTGGSNYAEGQAVTVQWMVAGSITPANPAGTWRAVQVYAHVAPGKDPAEGTFGDSAPTSTGGTTVAVPTDCGGVFTWDGTKFNPADVLVWNGAAFVAMVELDVWDGAKWVRAYPCPPTGPTITVIAGQPGHFVGTVPADLTALQALNPTPDVTTSWYAIGGMIGNDRWVVLGDGMQVTWTGTAWDLYIS